MSFDDLLAAENNDDIEIASRAKYLVERISSDWTRDADSPAVKHILENYAARNDEGRLEVFKQLAKLPADGRVRANVPPGSL